MNIDLSAFYFDIRKDALLLRPDLLGPPPRQPHRARPGVRRADRLARPDPGVHHGRGLARAAPRRRSRRCTCASSRSSPRRGPTTKLDEKWEAIREVRKVVTGALEIARRDKVIGASLEAAPQGLHHRRQARRRCPRHRHGRNLDHLGHRGHRRRGPAERLPARRSPRRRRASSPKPKASAVPFLADPAGSRHRHRVLRTSASAMPRRCANRKAAGR